MATEIGPGTRVWCGFCSEAECRDGREWARGRTGTVTGQRVDGLSLLAATVGLTYWGVQIDGADQVCVRSDMLYPIDDGDPHETDDTTERPRVLEGELT